MICFAFFYCHWNLNHVSALWSGLHFTTYGFVSKLEKKNNNLKVLHMDLETLAWQLQVESSFCSLHINLHVKWVLGRGLQKAFSMAAPAWRKLRYGLRSLLFLQTFYMSHSSLSIKQWIMKSQIKRLERQNENEIISIYEEHWYRHLPVSTCVFPLLAKAAFNAVHVIKWANVKSECVCVCVSAGVCSR